MRGLGERAEDDDANGEGTIGSFGEAADAPALDALLTTIGACMDGGSGASGDSVPALPARPYTEQHKAKYF